MPILFFILLFAAQQVFAQSVSLTTSLEKTDFNDADQLVRHFENNDEITKSDPSSVGKLIELYIQLAKKYRWEKDWGNQSF